MADGDLKLGAVLVNFHSMDETISACLSLLHGSRPPDEIVVVDNGSSPSEQAQFRSTVARANAHLLAAGANLGYAKAVNQGAARAVAHGCDALLLLNNDVQVPPDCLRSLIDGWCQDLEIRSPVVLKPGADGTLETWWSGGRISPLLGRAVHERSPGQTLRSKGRTTETGFISGCSMLVGAGIWAELQGLSGDYFLYWEDVDFCYRAHSLGKRLVCVNDAYIVHTVGASSGDRERLGSPTASYFGARNRWLFLRRTRHPRLAIAANLALTAPRLGRMLLQSLSGDALARKCFKAAVRGTVDGIQGDFSMAKPL